MNFCFRQKDQATICLLLMAAVTIASLRFLAVAEFGFDKDLVAVEYDRISPYEYRFVLDVNSAEWNRLTLLPGIGERLAHRIVDFRKVHGRIDRIDQLLEVNGIGPKKLESIRPYLYTLRQD